VVEALARTQVPTGLVDQLSRRFSDFARLYGEYRAQHGDTLLAVFQSLGYIATHGSSRNSNRAVQAMVRLLQSPN